MSEVKQVKLNLPRHLLWEYDMDKFDFDKSWFIVVERVIERGNILEWRQTQNYYGKEKMLKVANASRQLTNRDKAFTKLYIHSNLNDPRRSTNY